MVKRILGRIARFFVLEAARVRMREPTIRETGQVVSRVEPRQPIRGQDVKAGRDELRVVERRDRDRDEAGPLCVFREQRGPVL